MKARHAARELAMLALFQLERHGKLKQTEHSPRDFDALSNPQELVLSAVRALGDEARDRIQDAADDLAKVSQYLVDLEFDHPDNQSRPIDAELLPVAIPSTREMAEKIESCLLAAEYLFEALRLPELLALSQLPKVQAYTQSVLHAVIDHLQELDAELDATSDDWRLERMVKLDRCILRLALAEMRYMPDLDAGVSIDEAVELAKQFSTPESYRMINGILGKLAQVSQASCG